MSSFEEPEAWADSSLPLVQSGNRRRAPCKLPFGVFLSLIVGVTAALAALSIGLLFFNAASDANVQLARELQNLTSLNVRQSLSLIALVPRANLLVLSSQIAVEYAYEPTLVSPESERLRRMLYS